MSVIKRKRGRAQDELIISPELRDLISRRTRPFLDHVGLHNRSISFLLEEAYLQGLRDAAQTMKAEEDAGL